MKQITIAGNIGKSAEVRHRQDGTPVAGFSVAVEDRSGKEKKTVWFECSLWGRRGETLAQYLTKGSKVVVTGELSTREYNGKTYLQVRADNVTLMGGGQRGEKPEGMYSDRGEAPSAGHALEDEIPFMPEVRA
jgi:single-strand DNA-binding protein